MSQRTINPGEVKNITRRAGNFAGSHRLEVLGIERRKILRRILIKYCGKLRTVVMWLTIDAPADCR